MYYIYILFSEKSNLYYIGFSQSPSKRLIEHNSTPFNTFTAKHRPWALKALFECGNSEKNTIRLERFIKKQKSRTLTEQLCDNNFIPSGYLAQLVRVPDIRD
jgi:putative endonuclease